MEENEALPREENGAAAQRQQLPVKSEPQASPPGPGGAPQPSFASNSAGVGSEKGPARAQGAPPGIPVVFAFSVGAQQAQSAARHAAEFNQQLAMRQPSGGSAGHWQPVSQETNALHHEEDERLVDQLQSVQREQAVDQRERQCRQKEATGQARHLEMVQWEQALVQRDQALLQREQQSQRQEAAWQQKQQ
ncbi:hypothetical protein T484DRAFT_1795772 [Baffinella frigidus]|nr:hypothetical protein T484DRAFT_1795772 [Cryptophyta sp. CCMP2293]